MKQNHFIRMNYPIKKLFNGYASVRSNVVKECIKRNEDLNIFYRGEQMTIPCDKLKSPLQFVKRTFNSKYKSTYSLLDFKWQTKNDIIEEVNETPKQLKLI